MESSGLLSILVLFILLANVQQTAHWRSFRKCPRISENCEFKERDICQKDSQCQDNEKCCVFSCGKKCLDLKQDVCSLPKETGLCMAYFRRWWYNKENNTCDLFIYGGCYGNNNNFQTKGMCQNFCGRKVRSCPKIRVKCEVEERSQCLRHRHCPDKMKCCLFGCGKKCLDLSKDVCTLPKDTGPCLAFLPCWWYDKETDLCSNFIYGGCNGNPNNFPSEEICKVI
ncbi:eppin isoform X1 [Fukomys damarensis]|uniref:eppin isoform X1 n=1 Tax=Fukomys damarensis TaxID=885580 RepID=UPI00053FDA48|nr:eppin isoform X1 [Fukomys damarensis]